MKDKGKLTYTPGMFHLYMITDALDFWDEFPEKMWGLGFEMDCCNSFEEYAKQVKLKKDLSSWTREGKRNILYVLEHAPQQIVGNYLFSMWRYFTHWNIIAWHPVGQFQECLQPILFRVSIIFYAFPIFQSSHDPQ